MQKEHFKDELELAIGSVNSVEILTRDKKGLDNFQPDPKSGRFM